MPRLVRRAAAAITLGSLSLSLSLASGASAQSPPPAAAPGAMSLGLERVHRVGRDDVALRGDRVRVRGVVAPYAPGQTAVVRVSRGRRKVSERHAPIQPVPGTANGTFVVRLRPPTGRVTVRARHRATTAQAAMAAKPRRLLVVAPHAAPGARGAAVRLLQSRLAALRYSVSRSGEFDAATARAVVAYRKMTRQRRVAMASRGIFRDLLAGRGAFKPRYPTHGKHVEVDLSRQVLVLMRGRRVDRIYSVSSGKPSTPTVLGRFRVYSKVRGTNAKGMVHTSYFIGGYAIHGYVSVPTFPASHGCVRVPIPNALSIFNWLRVGDRVDVYP